MRIIAGAIRNPVAIGVTVLLISLFGVLSLKNLLVSDALSIKQRQVGHQPLHREVTGGVLAQITLPYREHA